MTQLKRITTDSDPFLICTTSVISVLFFCTSFSNSIPHRCKYDFVLFGLLSKAQKEFPLYSIPLSNF